MPPAASSLPAARSGWAGTNPPAPHHKQARYSTKAQKRRAAAGGGGEDVAFPAGRATVQAGLRSYGLSKAEQQRFAHCAPAYREAR